MANDWRDAEDAAPVDQSGPLPGQVTTLRYLPQEARQQYVRMMDGSFRLDWVNASQARDFVEEVATGRLKVVPDGETPETVAAKEAEQARQFQAELAKGEKAELDERLARIDREEQAEIERIQAEKDRIRQSFGAGAAAG